MTISEIVWHVEHADVHSSKVILEHSLKGFNFMSKSKTLTQFNLVNMLKT